MERRAIMLVLLSGSFAACHATERFIWMGALHKLAQGVDNARYDASDEKIRLNL